MVANLGNHESKKSSPVHLRVKVNVILEVLRQDKTLNQIASEHGLHPQLLQT
jgi:hypothetical protein